MTDGLFHATRNSKAPPEKSSISPTKGSGATSTRSPDPGGGPPTDDGSKAGISASRKRPKPIDP